MFTVKTKVLAGKLSPATQARIQKGQPCKRETIEREELKITSVFCPFHVEPCLIRLKIFRSRFLGAIVQFADFMINDVIVALTRDFFFAHQIAPCRPSNLDCFKRVASEEHSCNGVFRC